METPDGHLLIGGSIIQGVGTSFGYIKVDKQGEIKLTASYESRTSGPVTWIGLNSNDQIIASKSKGIMCTNSDFTSATCLPAPFLVTSRNFEVDSEELLGFYSNPSAGRAPTTLIINNGRAENEDECYHIPVSTFNAYPNPTSDFLTITLVPNLSYEIELFDLHGQLLSSSTTTDLNSVNLDARGLACGTYVVTLRTKGHIERIKFVKI